MVTAVTGAMRPIYGLLRVLIVMLALLALLLTTSIAAPRARAATPLKAVLIVGPSGLNSQNLTDAANVATSAAGYGMNVVKLYTPHATWTAVSAAMQGANFVVYWGHGNGWPSSYSPFQEKTKDGFGLNATDGSSTVAYYGGNYIRSTVTLAKNAIVGLSHACYTSGNWEPGMSIPTYDVARQDADNYAAAFLAVGAQDVFALETGSFTTVLDGLFTTQKTMDGIFSTPGSGGLAYYGFVGWNDKYFDSVRMPGNKNHLDPEQTDGYRRALTGNMGMTVADWMSGAGTTGGGGGGTGTGPTVTAPRASFVANTSGLGNITIHVDWDASPSPNVTSYELQYSVDSSTTWTPVTLGSPTALSVNVALSGNHWYQFRLRATDSTPTTGAWVTATNRKLVKKQESDTSMVWSGTWSAETYMSGASASYVKSASASGNKLSWTFTGTWVSFVSTLAANRGMAQVWVDGALAATVDLYSATTQKAHVVWVDNVAAGTHVVEVRPTGTKNSASTGTRVDADAFVSWK